MTKTKKPRGALAGDVLTKVAPRIGAKVIIEPEWGVVGQIRFASGRKRYFRFSSIDMNTLGASEISRDKDYANFFMKQMGYPTIEGKTFFSDKFCKAIKSRRDIDAAYRYACSLGLPVIVKPNSGSQGRGVALVHTKAELYRAVRRIFRIDRVCLVQRPVQGRDYRVVVLDHKVISAYERIPLNVTGDGRSNFRTLLARKQRMFVKTGRDTQIRTDDPRILAKLRLRRWNLDTVPPAGEQVFMLDNANLSSGGDSVDVTEAMHPGFRKLSVQLARDMGLRLCGVDLMVDGSIEHKPKTFWILETNAAPGLDHYAAGGRRQQKIVEDMYLEVLKHMDH